MEIEEKNDDNQGHIAKDNSFWDSLENEFLQHISDADCMGASAPPALPPVGTR